MAMEDNELCWRCWESGRRERGSVMMALECVRLLTAGDLELSLA